MKTYHESARAIPVAAEADVLICGGGPAGFGAAIAAAKAGAKTLLLEKAGSLGGMAGPGMMSHWVGSAELPLQREIVKRMSERPTEPLAGDGAHQNAEPQCITHESQKSLFFEMLKEAGAQLQLHTLVTDAIMEGNRIAGVITESKSGREAFMGKVVIDATGDGDVAARAGAEYLLGRETDNACQPVTLMFRIGGVDYSKAVFPEQFESFIDLPKGEIQALGKKHLPFPAGHVLLYRSRLPGEVCVNMTNVINVNGTDVRDLTRAEIECRAQIDRIIPFLREFVPGYERCYLVAAAENVGVRETRHFKGVYTLDEQDIVTARVFDDWIATRNYFTFDIHSIKGPGLDEHGAQLEFKAKGKYTIPYRACLPEKIDGLLLSGRNIAGTHKAHSNYRVMGICLGIGQGVGAAAAIAARHGILPRAVKPTDIQAILRADGIEP